MKKLIKYAMSFSLVFLLFPVSVIAGEIIEAKCGFTTWDTEYVIVATSIVGPIESDNFSGEEMGGEYGKWHGLIGIEALVNGNGNQARFSGIVDYEKVGNRLELDGDEIETTVTKEQFQEHFGLFPTVTCGAG